jgi:PleD family two-component response regulator
MKSFDERIRQIAERLSPNVQLGASMGVTALQPLDDAAKALARADAIMYARKTRKLWRTLHIEDDAHVRAFQLTT